MANLVTRLTIPPTDVMEYNAWRTSWNESYIRSRIEGAMATKATAERHIATIVRALRDKELIEASTTVQDLVHCVSGHLNTRLYPDQPVVSILLQYYSRPAVIDLFVNLTLACNQHAPVELIVNVDSPKVGVPWAG
jgi:hypothetical protein